MKKFFFKLSLFSLLFIINALILIFLDPYNVFHYNSVRDNGVEPNKNYIKTRYILDNPHKFDMYIFGSSRVGAIDAEAIPSHKGYNMTYSMGVPKEHLDNLKALKSKNIVPHTVLVGVDDMACYINPKEHNSDLLRIPYPEGAANNSLAYYGFLLKYLNPVSLLSIPIIISHKGNSEAFRHQFYENGGMSKNTNALAAKIDWGKAVVSSFPCRYGTENVLADIRTLKEFLEGSNIKLILFTNPLYKDTYEKAAEHGYIDFLARLSEVTEFYNFSGLNDITTDNANYMDTSHYTLSVGDMIIDTIFYNKTDERLLSQGFGLYVTRDTRKEFLEILRQGETNQP